MNRRMTMTTVKSLLRVSRQTAPSDSALLRTVEARYRDLLHRLGCCSHDGAIKEIDNLRRHAGLDKQNEMRCATCEHLGQDILESGGDGGPVCELTENRCFIGGNINRWPEWCPLRSA